MSELFRIFKNPIKYILLMRGIISVYQINLGCGDKNENVPPKGDVPSNTSLK